MCGVPYLRQRDLCQAEAGQTADQIAAVIRDALGRHYREVHNKAEILAAGRPIITTGHLAAIASVSSSSERAIYIGNLGAIDAECFAGCHYAALGHIHRAQCVGGQEHIRYVGSPLCLSFDEVDCPKEIRIIDVHGNQLTHRALDLPRFRPLLRLTVDLDSIGAELARHAAPPTAPFPPWIELTVARGANQPDLDRQVREAAASLNLRILKILRAEPSPNEAPAVPTLISRTLEDLRPEDVFAERLLRQGLDPQSGDGATLALTFAELLSHFHEAAAPAASP